ncbi:MAG TPA: Fe-S cluster assembly protein SufB [Candidatus Babeliales bacterium]|jgi:Fe-S cluster assembly protein SufB|nr:Fe-S cluster assembly protein SufB [Candidatus Babeliales bacterium]
MNTNDTPLYKSNKGLNKQIVQEISERKQEPGWMTDYRLKALAIFESKPMPTWGANLSALDVHDIYYYIKPIEKQHSSWDSVPETIKQTFNALGIPQAEQKFLAGVGAQYESEVIYKQLKQEWATQGVLFMDTSTALREHASLFKRYFGTVIPSSDNKFAALNSAVWSGGSFVYVPAGVHITMPLQAYFRINTESMGQFERTLIIAQPGSFVHYVEGCSAPLYQTASLHSAVVELIALEGSHIRYTTIQNWSNNVYNLVTKRAIAYRNAKVEWVDGNFGSKVTMKYPCIILKEPGAKGHILSIAVSGAGQIQDAGGKIIHMAPYTTSNVLSKSISRGSGRASYRGLLKVIKGAHHVKSTVQCDALLLDTHARSDTYPTIIVNESDTVTIGHEASVSAIDESKIWYLQSRGLTETQARALIVNGFIDSFIDMLPMEYAVEINRLIAHQMEGSIG